MKSDRYRVSYVLCGVIILHAVFIISPVSYLLGFRTLVVVPGTLLVLAIVMALERRVLPVWVLILVTAALSTACVSGVYWESWKVALYPVYFAVSLLSVTLTNMAERRAIVTVGSILLVVILVGAWFSFLGALSGVPSVGQFVAATGRVITVYPTTLTPFAPGNFIRPAGVYDEPGALSLIVCVFSFLRHALGMDRRITWTMLLLGFVTFSLAHLVYVVFHFLAERRVAVVWSSLVLASAVVVIALSSAGLWDYFDSYLVERLKVSSQTGRLIKGDNRTKKLTHAYDALADGGGKVFLFGVDVACTEGSKICQQSYPLMGENPLTPIAHQGVLVSWSYYLFVAIAVVVGISKRTRWPLFAVALLFVQRPSVLSAGYSMLAALAIWTAYRDAHLADLSESREAVGFISFESRHTRLSTPVNRT